MAHSIKVASWNVGALQTNPLEFWQPTNSKHRQVQENLDQALQGLGRTIQISDIVSAQMIQDILALDDFGPNMEVIGDVFESIKTISVHAYLTDKNIGRKRFVSMADRLLRDRPSLISSKRAPPGISTWWPDYLNYLQETKPIVNGILKSHNSPKYGDQGFSKFDKEYYRELQLLHLAIADACHVFLAGTVPLVGNMIAELGDQFGTKFTAIKEILTNHSPDVICLQEVDFFAFQPLLGFDFYRPPASNGKQDSLILLRQGIFDNVSEVHLGSSVVGPGDLVLLTCRQIRSSKSTLIASYHGETNGTTTLPLLEAIHSLSSAYESVIVGSDTNAHYESGGSKLEFAELERFTSKMHWKLSNNANPTTRSCRTFFQAQAHKGHHMSEIHFDSDPKDNIIVGGGARIESSGIFFGPDCEAPIPNERFPSDHALAWAVVAESEPE